MSGWEIAAVVAVFTVVPVVGIVAFEFFFAIAEARGEHRRWVRGRVLRIAALEHSLHLLPCSDADCPECVHGMRRLPPRDPRLTKEVKR